MPSALVMAASRVAARVGAWHFARPLARAVAVAAGLYLLAFIGSTAIAGGGGAPAVVASSSPAPAAGAPALASPPGGAAVATGPPSGLEPAAGPGVTAVAAPPVARAPNGRVRATAADPVILNTATVEDLRRLPRIGEKRAAAIVSLRARLGGRFRVVEDLLKVRGIGRATFRQLRPLVRLDPAPAVSVSPPAGVSPPGGASRPGVSPPGGAASEDSGSASRRSPAQ